MIISILKCLIIKLQNFKNVKIPFSKNISFSSQVKAKNKGSINIGKGIRINKYSSIVATNGGIIEIGQNVSFNRMSICAAHTKISIGSNTSIGPNVCIYDHDHKFGEQGKEKGFNTKEVIIGDNVWIGAGTIILRGTEIGQNCVIGAGCVVKGNIPANSLVTQDRNLKISKLNRKGK